MAINGHKCENNSELPQSKHITFLMLSSFSMVGTQKVLHNFYSVGVDQSKLKKVLDTEKLKK